MELSRGPMDGAHGSRVLPPRPSPYRGQRSVAVHHGMSTIGNFSHAEIGSSIPRSQWYPKGHMCQDLDPPHSFTTPRDRQTSERAGPAFRPRGLGRWQQWGGGRLPWGGLHAGGGLLPPLKSLQLAASPPVPPAELD